MTRTPTPSVPLAGRTPATAREPRIRASSPEEAASPTHEHFRIAQFLGHLTAITFSLYRDLT